MNKSKIKRDFPYFICGCIFGVIGLILFLKLFFYGIDQKIYKDRENETNRKIESLGDYIDTSKEDQEATKQLNTKEEINKRFEKFILEAKK